LAAHDLTEVGGGLRFDHVSFTYPGSHPPRHRWPDGRHHGGAAGRAGLPQRRGEDHGHRAGRPVRRPAGRAVPHRRPTCGRSPSRRGPPRTRQPPTWTRCPSTTFRPRCARCCTAAPRSWSRTGCPQSWLPTRSSSSTRAASSTPASHSELLARGGLYARLYDQQFRTQPAATAGAGEDVDVERALSAAGPAW